MDPTQPNSQAAEQQWLEPPTPSQHDKFLEQRIEELEQQVAAYDALLNELPDLFERKFQERLAPILERYQLLSEQQQKNAAAADTPLLQSTQSPDNVVRFPGIKLMSFLRPRRRSA
ncbi:hypothetical protein N8463_02220 [Synechococcus sp. AH-601-P06]|jgi:hypothetical protein|nr:hypothetical protein [Synechococcus sp. AH-601-O20]MDA7437416.1 hypothetical protein [Synechococcus sp. AH-601-P06]